MGTSVSINIVKVWFGLIKSHLSSEISPDRYALIKRGNLLIATGSFIAIGETIIAVYLDLHKVHIKQTLFFSSIMLAITFVFFLIPVIKKNLHVWYEWVAFGIYMILFLIAFCIWEYRLGELRILAVINAITTVTILLSYISTFQSLIISAGVLICYYMVSSYAISSGGQPGSLTREAFLSFCLFPAFMLISLAAYYMNKKRKELQEIKSELEKLNNNLIETNKKLKAEQRLTEIEMDLARDIQHALFPAVSTDYSDWDLAYITIPAGAVSGDFYDFYKEGENLKGISLFDVSGHGLAPGLVTILTRPILYNYFSIFKSLRLGRVIESTSYEILEQLDEVNLYIAGLIVRIENMDVEYVNAGHPDILHLKTATGEICVIKDPETKFKGPPVGLSITDSTYSSYKFRVQSGDFLIFYSDGLTESRNSSGESYGLERLSDTLGNSPGKDAGGILNDIKESLYNFTGDVKSGDDVTIIVAGKK